MSAAVPIAETRNCRACGEEGFAPVISLGSLPLANALVDPRRAPPTDARYPLDVVRCRACNLLQLTCSVAPESLFGEYLYFSSFSDAFLQHARRLVDEVAASRSLGAGNLVAEIASNDGYLLQYYKARGIPVLGIEPARNIAKVAEEKRGISTIAEFFGASLAERLAGEGRRADVIHAHNVIAHVPDLSGVLRGIRTLLKPEGVAVMEVPYALDMIDRLEFDTIYHEHLCYFSLTSLATACRRAGLEVLDVAKVEVHGGSLRVFARRDDGKTLAAPSVSSMLEEERRWGVMEGAPYAKFSGGAERVRERLLALLRDLKDAGHSIAAYGAAAKGTVLTNYCGIDGRLVDFVADRSTAKQGLLIPGTRLRIEPADALLKARPDYVLLLAWNFAEEILAQQAEYRRGGGKFIVPVPDPVVL